MSGVQDQAKQKTSERLGNKRSRQDDIYFEKGMRGQPERRIDESLRNKMPRQNENGPSQGTAKEPDEHEHVQDQIIIAPEIMRRILEHLDVRGLKKVRLVCKSWLLEAQIHVKRRGVVCLSTQSKSTRIQEFFDMSRKKLSALPQPFKSVEVVLSVYQQGGRRPAKLLTNKLLSLCPPLSITKFFPTSLPLDLALLLVVQVSTSLVNLQLFAITCRPGYLPPMDPDHIFPKLTDLDVQASVQDGASTTGNHFPSIVAWIAKCSPILNNYCCGSTNRHGGTLEMVSELVLKVDIKNVESLTLSHKVLSDAAAEHFKSIPFTKLQDLEVSLHDSPELSKAVLMATVATASTTLKVLDLYLYEIDEVPDNFPICPNVQEIVLYGLDDWNKHISTFFPAVKTLSIVDLYVPLRGEEWEYNTPLCSLKELTVWKKIPRCCCSCTPEEGVVYPATLSEQEFGLSHGQTVKFFDTFPALERLEISDTFVLHCCRLKASGDPRFSDLMAGVKHLKLTKHCKCWKGVSHASDYSPLAILKGIESIEVELSEAVLSIPVQEMSGLKALRFPWDDNWKDVKKLLEITSGVEKVIITNCCSAPRVLKSALSKGLLMQFFEFAPNAECGCKGSERE